MEFTFSEHQPLLLHQTKHLAGCGFLLHSGISVQLSLTWAPGELKGDLQSSPGTDVSSHSQPQPSANSPSHPPSDQGWPQPFTKLTFTNPHTLNPLSVSDHKESLQSRVWSMHCFDAVLGLLHSLWNNFGWSHQEDEWTRCFLWITSLHWTKTTRQNKLVFCFDNIIRD